MNGAESMLAQLKREQVSTIFGLPGSTEASLLEALRADDEFRYVLALHEGPAVSMADGYSRVTGQPGLVGLHTTVGTMNGLSQIYNAYRDNSSVVVTAGHKDRAVLADDGFCAYPDLPSICRGSTKWAWQSLSAEAIAADVSRAIHLAMTPPLGPTYLALPEDLLRADLGDSGGSMHAPGRRAGGGVPVGPVLDAALALIAAADRPILVVGSSAVGAIEQIRAFSDRFGLPVLLTEFSDLANMTFPTSDHRYLGLLGEDQDLFKSADLVIAVGCRVFYPFSDASRPRLPPGARLVHIHPDPTELGRVVPADAALLGDPGSILAEMTRRAPSDTETQALELDRRRRRVEDLRAQRVDAVARERSAADEGAPISVEWIAEAIGAVLPGNAVVVDEGVRSSRGLLRHLEIGENCSLLRSSGGALGWGVPAAVGAKIGAPERPVVAVVGDGSFHFSSQALWTAVAEQAPVVVLILDNGGYLAVKRAIEGYLRVPHDPRRHPGTDITGIDPVLIAGAYGANGTAVKSAAELSECLEAALDAPGVHVIHVPVAQVRP